MKQIIMILSILLLIGTSGFGADWQSRLPAGISDPIRTHIEKAVRAGLSPEGAIALTKRMEENRFGDDLTVRAYEIIQTALKEGLPVDPIMNKASEGMAKKEKPEKVLQAMETVRMRYFLAFQQVRTVTADEKQQLALAQVIAEALAAGITEKDLSRLMENLRQQTRQLSREQTNTLSLQSFQVARDMARLRVSSETVTDVVSQALQNSYSSREMEQMRKSFTNDARHGNADSVAKQYSAQIGAGSRGVGFGLSPAGSISRSKGMGIGVEGGRPPGGYPGGDNPGGSGTGFGGSP
jgi:hypothetical protein